jgi:hypothetical protein
MDKNSNKKGFSAHHNIGCDHNSAMWTRPSDTPYQKKARHRCNHSSN